MPKLFLQPGGSALESLLRELTVLLQPPAGFKQATSWSGKTNQYRKIHQLNTTQKTTMPNTAQQNYSASVASYDT